MSDKVWVAEIANKNHPDLTVPRFWTVVVDKPRPYRDAIVNIFWHDGIHPEDEANAKLIAAAPELLAALIDCRTILKSAEESIQGRGNKCVSISIVLEKTRAAIAKATTP